MKTECVTMRYAATPAQLADERLLEDLGVGLDAVEFSPPRMIRCPRCRTPDLAPPSRQVYCYCRPGGALMVEVGP